MQFPPLKPAMCSSFLFQIHDHFFINCCCMYICIYIYTYIPNYNLLSLSSVICMCVFRADHWYWMTNWRACPRGRKNFSCSRYSSVACSSLCRVGVLWALLLSCYRAQWCFPCSAHIEQSDCEALRVKLLTLLGDTISQQILWSSGSYHLPTPSSTVLPRLYVWELYCRCVHWNWAPKLHFNWLWFSLTISICCKEKSLWWGTRTTLICGYKHKYLDCS